MTTLLKRFRDSDFHWLLIELKPHMKWQLLSVALMVASTITSLIDPLILRWLIDVVIPRRDLRLLVLAAFLMLLAYGSRVGLAGVSGLCTYHVCQRILRQLRMRVFKHITCLSMNYHDTTPVGKSMFVAKDTLDELGLISADFAPQILRTTALSTFTVMMMLHLDHWLTLVILPLVPLFVVTIRHFSHNIRKASDLVQAEGSNTSAFLQEHFSSVLQVQLLAKEKFQILKAFQIWTALMRAGYRRKRSEYVYGLSASLVVVVGVVAVVSYGGFQVISGTLSIGGLVAFYSYVGRLFEPLYVTIDINSRLQRARACIRRVRDVLELRPTIQELRTPMHLPDNGVGAAIAVRGLTFGYTDDRTIIKNVEFTISPNERMALVGPSGSGKSTIAKMLSRLYDAEGGTICIDGIQVDAVALRDLRRNVCYVPQRARLFSGSLRDNLKYGNSQATELQLQSAAEIAELLPVISKLPHGWEQMLGPSGELLSGGERQRVAIARAVLQCPRLLILDEATSEVDSRAEQTIFRQLNKHLADTTMIFISHRLSALSWVDQIMVLDDGRAVGFGNHDILYGRNILYTQLYDQGNLECATSVS